VLQGSPPISLYEIIAGPYIPDLLNDLFFHCIPLLPCFNYTGNSMMHREWQLVSRCCLASTTLSIQLSIVNGNFHPNAAAPHAFVKLTIPAEVS
jgi:hypothetical protein